MARSRPESLRRRRYEVVEQILAANIVGGRLPEGFLLLEGAVAEAIGTTRPPVRRALQNLQKRSLIRRFNGRGYLVGRSGDVEPVRGDIKTVALEWSTDAEEALANRSSGERIFETVEADVAGCVIFGQHRIIEAAFAAYFKVSRTIARDVLGRLAERGLVRKNQSSHWIAGPLTANTIREHFEIRRLLEPAALVKAAAHINQKALETLWHRLVQHEQNASSVQRAELFNLEDLFVKTCLLASPNNRLLTLIRDNLSPVRALERLLRQLGLPDDDSPVIEQRLIVELLLRGAVDAAAATLDRHLETAMHCKIAQMKIVAVLPEPRSVPAYLTRLDQPGMR